MYDEVTDYDEVADKFATKASIDLTQYKVRGLQVWNKDETVLKIEYIKTESKYVEYGGKVVITFQSGNVFELSADMNSQCGEKYGFTSGNITQNPFKWTPYLDKSVTLFEMSSEEIIELYLTDVTNKSHFSTSIICITTNNETIPGIGFYCSHNGYYTHYVHYSLTSPCGEIYIDGHTTI